MKDPNRKDDAELMRLRHGNAAERAELAVLAASDPGLQEDIDEWDRQDAALLALYDPVAKEPVPARLRAAITAAEYSGGRYLPQWSRIAALIALLSLFAAGGWMGGQNFAASTPGPTLAVAAFRAYTTYSVDTAHPVEVAASDAPQLEAWLSHRLGQHIVPPDLSARGFHLMGGRILPDANGTAVLLMYRDDLGRRLVLYVAPEHSQGESTFHFAQRDAMQSFWWFDDGLGCALVGNVPRQTLHQIAVDAYEQITAA